MLAAQADLLTCLESLGFHGILGDEAVMELQFNIFLATLSGDSGAEPTLHSFAGTDDPCLDSFSHYVCDCGFCRGMERAEGI